MAAPDPTSRYNGLPEIHVVAPDGTPRFRFVSFAGHFDSMMYGRRGIKRTRDERELNPYRKRFCEIFQRL